MKNYLRVALTVGLFTTQVANADVVGFEVGTYQWDADYSGSLSASKLAPGTNIGLNELGFTDESDNVVWLNIEHPLPLLPNFRMVSSEVDATATSNASVALTFNDTVFDEQVFTEVDFSSIDYTLYYELLDNWINLDAGMTIRQYDGTSRVTSLAAAKNSDTKLDLIIPLVYLSGRVELPFTGFFVDGEINFINYSNDQITDTAIALGYESDFGLGAKAGYRTQALDVSEDGFKPDIELDGAYISVFYHF